MADDVTDLSARRWERDRNPRNHSPRAAIERALVEFDQPTNPDVTGPPDHVVVVFGWSAPDGAADATFYQAGSFDPFASSGLLGWAARKVNAS